jgi:hypothetical protein
MDTNYDWGNSEFETDAMASLTAKVSAVADAVDHLMIEVGDPIPEFGSSLALLLVTIITATAVIGFVRTSEKRPR